MNAKKVAPLVLALILGLCAFYMALRVISKQKQTTVQTQRPEVVIAKVNIDAGQVLTDDVLDKGEISTDVLPTTVFQNTGDVSGRVATVPIIQGQAITQTLLAPKGVGGGLQAVVPMGMRAMTLDVNEITGVAGNIVPGVHIDVLQTFHDDRTGDQMSRTIVQNVKVTAVGMHHNPGDQPDGGAHSITVLVSPQEAETLELASMTGRPRFTLRNTNDLDLVDTSGVTLTELKGRESNQKDQDNGMVTPVINVAPSTQPAVNISYADPATRPSPQPSTWTMHIIHGEVDQEVKFKLQKPIAELLSPDSPLAP